MQKSTQPKFRVKSSKRLYRSKKADKGFFFAISAYTLLLNVAVTFMLTNQPLLQAQKTVKVNEQKEVHQPIVLEVEKVSVPAEIDTLALEDAPPLGEFIEPLSDEGFTNMPARPEPDEMEELEAMVAMEVTELSKKFRAK